MKTVESFFKRKNDDEETHIKSQHSKHHRASTSEPQPEEHENQNENDISEATQSNPNVVDLKHLERDPAKQKQIQSYMTLGHFQIRLQEYHAKDSKKILVDFNILGSTFSLMG
uniref:Uncharacterized protein n=1 Tax=Lactuca sativa TaxID=4236 RepID=A0A9R1W923_LACSA|nr:hypothetical protein LSAT_V11C300131540 [Lactuca sativa]